MTIIRLHVADSPAAKFHKPDATRDIDFTKVAEYAVILPVGVEIQKNTHTNHRSDSAASRWALRLKKKKINTVIVDKKGVVYHPIRDAETGKYGLISTDKTLENITIY